MIYSIPTEIFTDDLQVTRLLVGNKADLVEKRVVGAQMAEVDY